MTISTLLRYFCGHRSSILRIAETRHATWLGAILVFSAALAREYDGEDLVHQPWHLLLPLGASLLTSLLLFTLVFAVARRRGCETGPFQRLYPKFLGLYWMTAPLAWLYAIPVERFLSPGGATQVNLWLLAIVAVWRVALITRVIAVLFEGSRSAAIFLVMLFADTLALIILYLTPLPVFSIMGGIRLTESERMIQDAAFLVGFSGILSWPIWAVGSLVVSGRTLPPWKLAAAEAFSIDSVSRSLWSVAITSIVIWLPVLPVTQPEQQLRSRVEADLQAGRFDDAIRVMSKHGRDSFPPHWDPPPRVGYGEESPSVFDVLEVIVNENAPAWIRAVYVGKLNHDSSLYYLPWRQLAEADDEDFARILSLLERLPEGTAIVKQHRDFFERQSEDEHRSEALRSRIAEILDRTGNENDDTTE